MIFTAHLLLYLGAHGVSLACQRRGKFRFIGEFVADEAGYQAFSDALGQFKHARLSILVDSVDEQYQAESLPHVIGSARAQMLARRLRQVSRGSEFAAAWYQGREDHGRRDDRYLFVSLNTLDWAKTWLALLAQHEIHLAVLTTVPIVSHALVRELQKDAMSLLWVTQQSGGTRLSFFSQNRLLFSRLSTLESSQLAGQLADEIVKTRYYLTSHQYLPHQNPLSIAVLDTQQNRQRLCEILNQETGLNLSCHVRASDVLAQHLRVNVSDLHRHRDIPHLVALGRYSVAVNLATPAMTLGCRQMQWRRGLYSAAVGCLVVTAVVGGYLSYYRDQLTSSVVQSRTQLVQQQQRLQQALLQIPITPTAPANLKAAVEIADKLNASARPMPDFVVLSEILAHQPHITLTGLVWQHHNSDVQANTPSVLYVDGEVRPFQGNYRDAMADVNLFMAELRQHSRIEQVDAIHMPINRDPQSSLRLSAQEGAATATFKLKLLLKVSS